ncbi:MAG: DUF3843 family protein [Muribaculaceae bacterium]|nr:DUF3843 family protein [Muribaculaceae bacterium]
MEEKISLKQFEIRQPDYKRDESDEPYFYRLANHLYTEAYKSGLLTDWQDELIVRASLGIVGYFQDILADAGLWRSFIDMNRHLYQRTLPFFNVSDEYIDYELNYEDVRFLTWYSLTLNSEANRLCSPMDNRIKEVSRLWFDILEAEYESAPIPVSYQMGIGLELNEPEEREQIYHFGNWVFMYSYLMSPAYSMTMLQMMEDPVMKSGDIEAIQTRIEQSMAEDPTGPLALYLGEWLNLILEGKLPLNHDNELIKEPSKYYEAFLKGTGGAPIMFVKSYKELNEFFIKVLGWKEDEEHLPQMKGESDFVLLISRYKGLLLAKGIAKYICHPLNPYYERKEAEKHAMELLTVRGKCPGDLLRYLGEGHYLPDACFENSDDNMLVQNNFDFISRCYLQLYYRGD